ncbi:MAG: hypothetical protein M1537_04035 [Nitrospirae bacterium]|nr:hypothetical protein [Nitrospirota bacterium]MCL5285867.1 hypothetical protein [Nitrospirota bacterium]
MNPYVISMSVLIYLALTGYLTALFIRSRHGAATGRFLGGFFSGPHTSDFIRIRRGHIFAALFGFTCDVSGTAIMEYERIQGRIRFHPVPPALDWFHLITAQGALWLFVLLMLLGFLRKKGHTLGRFHAKLAPLFLVVWLSSSISGWFYRVF